MVRRELALREIGISEMAAGLVRKLILNSRQLRGGYGVFLKNETLFWFYKTVMYHYVTHVSSICLFGSLLIYFSSFY